MMAQTNHDDFDDELLSAYVDGELTAAERALVEERLRSDPTAAALVEELRSLSSAIKLLPRETLGRDLRAGVLAEVAQARADLDSHGPAAQSHATTLPLAPVDRWAGIRRGLVWSALAIAATVLIAVFQPAELAQDERELARAEKRRAMEKAPPEAEIETLERRLRGLDGAKEKSSVDKLAEAKDVADAEALPPGLRGSMGSGNEPIAVEAGVKALAAKPEAAPAPESPAPTAAAAVPVGESLALDAVEQDALYAAPAEKPADFGRRADAATNGQASDGMAALQDAPEQPRGVLMAPLSSAEGEGAQAASGAPTTLAMGGMGGGGVAGPRGGEMYGFGGEAGAVAEARAAGQATNAPAPTVTLKLAKPDGALRFQELLAESEIAPAEDVDRQQDVAGEQTERFSRSEGVDMLAEEAKLDAAEQRDAADQDQLVRSRYFFFSEFSPEGDVSEADDSLGVELRGGGKVKQSLANRVWVEATPAQMDALLEKCRSAKDAFAAVEAHQDLPLAKRAASLSAKLEMKRQLSTESEPASSSSTTEPRERVLFVLEPPTTPAELAAPAAAAPAANEVK
jgi:anti-sigma factor RsiW